MAQADNLKPVFIDQDILMDTSDCHFSDNKYIAPSKEHICFEFFTPCSPTCNIVVHTFPTRVICQKVEE